MKMGLIPAAGGAVNSAGSYVAEYAAAAEASGFDSIWLGEHPALPVQSQTAYPGRREGLTAPSSAPLPDPLQWLAFAAASTTSLLLGTAIVILPLHHPVVLAKRVATLDQLSGGRVRLGIGLGWNPQEYAACGAAWEGRADRCEESMEALRVLWRDNEASFEGRYVGFEPVYCSPHPVRSMVPILVGSSSLAGARRAGRLGDGYLPFERDHVRLAEHISAMKAAAVVSGRDPGSIEITALGGTRPERVKLLADLGVNRMLLFEAEIGSISVLGARLHDLIAEVESRRQVS
jgi:probable F420-dependent oxidoreductase